MSTCSREYEILVRGECLKSESMTDADIHNQKGIELLNEGKFENAIVEFDKAIEKNHDLAIAYNNKGLALENLQRYEEAFEYFNRALIINPVLIEAIIGVGNSFYSVRRYEEAINEYDKAIKIKSDYASVYYNKGLALSRLGNYSDAISAFDKSIELETSKLKIESYIHKGLSFEKLGLYNEAIEAYDKALEIEPTCVDAYINKGIALSGLGHYEDAILQYVLGISINPNSVDPNVHIFSAISFEKLGRYDEAIEEYNKAIQIKPNLAEAYYQKGLLLEKLNRFHEANEEYKKGLKWVEIGNSLAKNIQARIKKILNKIQKPQKVVESSEDILNCNQALTPVKGGSKATDYHIFKSYAHKDKNIVDPFINMLVKQYGLNVWVDTEDLIVGNSWRQQIAEGIITSKLVLCFITKNYLESNTCRAELKVASESRKPFFLVMLEDVSIDDDLDIKMHIIGKQRILMYLNKDQPNFWSGDMLHKLLKGISLAVDVPIPVVTIIEPSELNITDWNKLTELGSGLTSVVYETTYEGKMVAVKKFNASFPRGKSNEQLFKREVELLGRVKHENIVKLLGYFNKSDTYIVLEHMDGCSLYDQLYGFEMPTLEWSKSLKIIKSILQGLNYLHESAQIRHGDLKSPNVLINKECSVAKLADFGLSQIVNTISSFSVLAAKTVNLKTENSGSIKWMAPEQLKGEVTRKSDIWSFGLILRELSMRKLPFETLKDDTILSMLQNDNVNINLNIDGVPSKIQDLIRRCVERDPHKRVTLKYLINEFSLQKSISDLT